MAAWSLTRQLTDLVLAKPVTEADLQQAALFALDAFANALAGRNSAPGTKLLAWQAAHRGDTARQAFVIGGLTHILETDDVDRLSVTHPGCAVVPAAYMLARRRGASGRDFLIAVLRGYEAMCRVGAAVGPAHYRIWHNTATCGPFGSAMAAASLLQLTPEAVVDALGNAGTQAAGLWEFLATGAMSKHLHAGRAAEAGLVAAELAMLGFSGPPAILEGPRGFFAATCPDADPEAVLRDAAGPWRLCTTSIKPWPSCRHTHPAIDAAQTLRGDLLLDAQQEGDIREVVVETYQAALDVCDRPEPQSPYEAKFSLQHCTAAGLLFPRVDFAAFEAEAREEAAGLRARVRIVAAEPYRSAYPQAWGSAVRVEMRDGSRRAVARTHAKGDPEAPLSLDEMRAKAIMLLDHGRVVDGGRLIAAVLALAEGGPLPEIDFLAPVPGAMPGSLSGALPNAAE
jgi:2-methylcitrate dehydratase PrpD